MKWIHPVFLFYLNVYANTVTEPIERHYHDGDHNNSSGGQGGDPEEEGVGLRSLSHISEAPSPQHGGESWAITQKFQTAHGPKSPTVGIGSIKIRILLSQFNILLMNVSVKENIIKMNIM